MKRTALIIAMLALTTLGACRTTHNPQSGNAWQNLGLMLMNHGQYQMNSANQQLRQRTTCSMYGNQMYCW